MISRLLALALVLVLVGGCAGAMSATQKPTPASGQLQVTSADWPAFRAVFRETNYPEDNQSAGTIEVWEIVYRGERDWRMVALDGQTTGSDTLPDGTRFSEHVDPGTVVTMSAEGLTYEFPDGATTTVSNEPNAPNRWLQQRYDHASWQRERASERTVVTQIRSADCVDVFPDMTEPATCSETVRAELNRYGVPTTYTEDVEGSPTFTAEILEFDVIDDSAQAATAGEGQ